MSLLDSSASLLATCGGDTVKLFDVSVKSADPCILSYTPSPGSQVNSVKWNHTNLVVASAGDDKKISLWRKNGQSMGTVPLVGTNVGDDIEEAIVSINFSNKSSRYLCSGGSGRVVRIWDLQRKRCIKWLSGHTDTITGVMYNCKDEHLASISMKGDLILHNLASGTRAADFKDPFGQVLRVLDYSRLSRHILAIAGDDGSIHLWDTTGRAPKVSWLKQHSAPTTGVCFSPSSDKIIASVGLDKKLYTFDSAMRRPTSCVSYEAPFSSLSYSEDGNILSAGTNGGLIVFYDVRGKPQPFTILHAFNSSEAVTSLFWQRLKPFIVNESNCTAEIALLGGASEDSVLMPDPRPFVSSSFSAANTVSSSSSSVIASISGSMPPTLASSAEETPLRSSLWRGGSLAKLQAPRGNFNLKDDMDVFSPLVDVQPITPSLGSLWDDHDEVKKESVLLDKKSLALPNTSRRFPFTDGDSDSHKISDWRSNASSKQDDALASPMAVTPAASSKSESCFSPTPTEAWGGNGLPGKFTQNHPPSSSLLGQLPSTSLASGSTFRAPQDLSSLTSQFSMTSLTNPTLSSLNLQSKSILNNEKPSTYFESSSSYDLTSASSSFGTRPATSNVELPGSVQSILPRRYTTYVDRLSTLSSFSDGINSATSSPKSKKTGAETREELLNNLLSRQDLSTAIGNGNLPSINGASAQHPRAAIQTVDQLGSSSFSLQLVQRTLEETLGSVQKSIHDDVKNLHIDLLRQFHLQEMAMSNLLNSVLEKQDELIKEIQTLRRENQQLRQLL
ncbi:hypothetical protein IEQ34_012936 [Dendrobium chrysotoxum]|uniref:Protein NEDD1 n=1 Tax=Dendrobium chrysotoxum TaxID=161865 RepID=A0AAV7GM24_DENCH|nr:hypothetical protein IEQ34_012936 [Dendrobium chrysotoxum]